MLLTASSSSSSSQPDPDLEEFVEDAEAEPNLDFQLLSSKIIDLIWIFLS